MNLPSDFVKKYQTLLGSEADAFFASFEKPVNKGFRINPLKQNATELNEKIDQPVPYTNLGYYGKIDGNNIDHISGYVYSQEPSAMYVGEVVNPKGIVLDLCAAPGGKTTHLASLMEDKGLLISNEINSKRAKVLSENVSRFGLSNTIVTNANPKDLEQQLPTFFDQILVDAPCSGEGMFHKDEDAMQFWSEDYPLECANRQKKILQSAIKMLKPGGELTYSTCTFSPEEDEQIAAWLLDTYPFLEMVEIKKFDGMSNGRPEWANGNPELKKAVRLFPHQISGEGHFIAKFKRTDQMSKTKQVKAKPSTRLTSEQSKLWREFVQKNLSQDILSNPLIVNGRLYQMPDETPLLDHIHVLRWGIYLGEFKKNRFEPSFDSIFPLSEYIKTTIDLNDSDYQKYLHGEQIRKDDFSSDKLWVGVKYQNKPFSWGHLVNQTVKNQLPKRIRK